jgi:nucleoside 2-deoxyribosyltransferase
MGRNSNEYAWITEAIFNSLHHSAVVIVDLTGLRNNCFMEYGYALGRAQRVILTARKGTSLPFDTQAIDCHMWEDDVEDTERIAQFQEYWRRNIDRPPLVKPRELL